MKLVSLNIERSKHLRLVVPFLTKESADVFALEELVQADIPLFEQELGASCHFAPMALHGATDDESESIVGVGVFSRLPIRKKETIYYWGNGECNAAQFDFSSAETKHATESYPIVYLDVEVGSVVYRIASTHFIWTPDGMPDDFQRNDLKAMLRVLNGLGEFVLCGDFNAPRGGEIFSALADRYKDNIPSKYKTSIDINLHRAGKTQGEHLSKLMVDGLFTTPQYIASDVSLEFGVSDHAAIVATIAKATTSR
jgi:endonuclease/exonuclease/phosphatase family metal-dependent hydrolase